MVKKDIFFFFGFGQTAKYFISELKKSKRNFHFCTTNTKKTYLRTFKSYKFNSFKFKNETYDKRIIIKLKQADYILVSIPPQNGKDLVLKSFSKILKESKFKKLIYLSATSVYGNHNGKWVNENSKLKGKTKFGLSRKQVEKKWLQLRDLTKKDINILRVSGIYSRESNVLKKILEKKIYVKEKKFFSRIRVEDLAIIIKKNIFLTKKMYGSKCI